MPLKVSREIFIEAVRLRDLGKVSAVLERIEELAAEEDVLTAAKYVRQLVFSADLIRGERQDPAYWALIHEAVEALLQATEKQY